MMTESASIICDNNCLRVSGDVGFATVANLWKMGLPLLANTSALSFDFSQVTRTDSAALALLLEWLKYAKREGKSIVFLNLPAQVVSLAEMTGIERLVGFDNANSD